jgi:hypothetical protein
MNRDDFLALLPERERMHRDVDLKDKTFDIHYGVLGNFTIFVILDAKGLWPGVSKRMPTDVSSNAGILTAAVRAWRLWRGRSPGYSRPRPISKRGAKKMAASALISQSNKMLLRKIGRVAI